jgi:NADP-dependent 3-hydroxy acid dehydrogenase YdfG
MKNDKIILMTGASDGLGFATSKILIEKGYKVVGLCRKKPDNENIQHIFLDLTDEKSMISAAQQIKKLNGSLVALVNCAGLMSKYDRTDKKEFQDIINVYSVNVMGAIYFTNLLLDRIIEEEADVINVSSTAGIKGSASEHVYCSSKWAIRGFTKCLQEAFKKTNSRAISFCPGGINNKMLEKITGEKLPDPENWMPVEIIAQKLVETIDTPKQAEISEIIIARKK